MGNEGNRILAKYENRGTRGYALWVYILSPGTLPLVVGPTHYTPRELQRAQENFPEVTWEDITMVQKEIGN